MAEPKILQDIKSLKTDIGNISDSIITINAHVDNSQIHLDSAGKISSAAVSHAPDNKTISEVIETLKSSVSSGKDTVATAITDMGVAASGINSFTLLASKIKQIYTGKKYASGTGSQNIDRTTLKNHKGDWYIPGTGVVSNLQFKPSLIIMYTYSRQEYDFTIYFTDFTDYPIFCSGTGVSQPRNRLALQEGISVTSSGFELPAPGSTFNWIAYE